MKDFGFSNKKKDQNTLNALNLLIYDYLVKMKLEKTAKTFACEAYIEEHKITEGPPVLSQWYIAFNEISNVRCGLSSNPGDLSRIEGIMLKLENEKKRYQQMSRMDHVSHYNIQRDPNEMYKPHGGYYPPSHYSPHNDHHQMYMDPRKQIEMRNMGMHGRMRYEDQNFNRFDLDHKTISPKMFDQSPKMYDQSPKIYDRSPKIYEPPTKIYENSSEDKPFILREISTFKLSDKKILSSVLSKEHNILFNVFENKSIGSFNCSAMKNECIVETNGKQISSLKLKDTPDFIWIVASFDTNELMVIRYLIKEIKFEMAGYLRGHAENIICFDISDSIFSLDASGYLRKWNFKGICQKEEMLSGNLQKMYLFSENCLILSDTSRTYLYDFEMNMETTEISKGILLSLKKHDSFYILIFREKVAIYDKGLNKVKVLSVPSNSIKTACLVGFDIFVGSSHILWFETNGRLNKINVNENNEIVAAENISKYKLNHMIVLTDSGECKIFVKCFE